MFEWCDYDYNSMHTIKLENAIIPDFEDQQFENRQLNESFNIRFLRILFSC